MKRINTDNRGISLVELVVVIAIMVVLVGLISISVSVMFSRDATSAATKIDDELSEARMLSMSRDGTYTCVLHIDSDTKKHYIKIDKAGETDPYRKADLVKPVTITVTGHGGPFTGDIAIEFDKAKGCVKKVGGSNAQGVYAITVTSERNSSNVKTVYLISETGRHYVDD